MSNEIQITPELRAAGYIGKFGLIFMSVIMAPFGAVFGAIFFGMIFYMVLGEDWGNLPLIAGAVLGVLMAVGMVIQKIEEGNLKARALVNAAHWEKR